MLHIVGKTYAVPREQLEKVAKATFSFLKLSDAEIELKFVSVGEMTRLNRVYRGKNGPTDVLSFGLSDKPLLGQVFICYNFTKEQAKRVSRDLSDEVSLLLTHGILHIAGYDHATKAEEAEMQQIETKILGKVGVERC